MSITLSEAYEMYMMGTGYKEICKYLHCDKHRAKYQVKVYAQSKGLIYPRPPQDHTVVYNLYVNGVGLKDLGRFLGITECAVWLQLKRYCLDHHIEMPTSGTYDKARLAYRLRQQGRTYEQVATMVGYDNRSNCYRAIKSYLRACKVEGTEVGGTEVGGTEVGGTEEGVGDSEEGSKDIEGGGVTSP